ncbi:tyrosine-type recombinase/integrase [Haloarcula sp. H-GB5]
MLAWGGQKYDASEMHDATLTGALEDRDAAGEIVEWIHENYPNEETNRDMRNALRVFGKVLASDDPTSKAASPPPSIDQISATTSETYDPLPNASEMIAWEEVKTMCEHPKTNARDAALIALAWDAGPRSGELEELRVGDVFDHDVGQKVRIEDGKTGTRHPTITNAVPYLRQWLNQHPATDSSGDPEDPAAPMWSKLKTAESISYRQFRDVFKNAAERVGLEKPDTPTNFRKSSASHLASKGVSQAHLEKRYGWERGSDAAARYIRVFGEDADKELIEARGMDVEIEEDEPDGPKECVRCRRLIDREAEKCDVCGAIQDEERAAKESAQVSDGDLSATIESAVQEEVEKILSQTPQPPEGDKDAQERAQELDEKLKSPD